MVNAQDSLKAIEWGYLDSLRGVYTLDKVPYTGPVFKKLGIGLMTGSYKEGIKHGLWQTFNNIGEPLMIGNYNEGKKDGTFEQWYDDGERRRRELVATFDQNNYLISPQPHVNSYFHIKE